MRVIYGGLATLMMISAMLFFFVDLWLYKVFLTELVVSVSTFMLLGVFTLMFLVPAWFTRSFYKAYTELLEQ